MPHRYQTQFAICAIAKDENSYVLEWAAYHLGIGFDHVFIYDNQSKNPLVNEFAGNKADKYVTITRWPTALGRNAQIEAYAHCIEHHGSRFDWIAIIDLDEFINLKMDKSINDFLSRFENADGIVVNWRIFGSSGEQTYRPAPTMARFTRASPVSFHPNGLVKSIFRPRSVVGFRVHHALYREDALVLTTARLRMHGTDYVDPIMINLAEAQINHYFVKSREEWRTKVLRGYTDGTIRTDQEFDSYDLNDVEDITIMCRMETTLRWMRDLAGKRPDYFRSLKKIFS